MPPVWERAADSVFFLWVGMPGTGNLPRTARLIEVATKTNFAVHSLEKDGLRQAELCPRYTMMLRQDTLAEYPDGDCSHF